MTTTCAREGDDLVVSVSGDLDAATWEEPVDALAAVLTGHPDVRVVVDLGGVTFLDSSGIGSLVRMRALWHDADVAFVLRRVGPKVSRLLAIAGLGGVFDVLPVSAP